MNILFKTIRKYTVKVLPALFLCVSMVFGCTAVYGSEIPEDPSLLTGDTEETPSGENGQTQDPVAEEQYADPAAEQQSGSPADDTESNDPDQENGQETDDIPVSEPQTGGDGGSENPDGTQEVSGETGGSTDTVTSLTASETEAPDILQKDTPWVDMENGKEPSGSKEDPYRYRIAGGRTVRITREFLAERKEKAEEQQKSECWISLETTDDPEDGFAFDLMEIAAEEDLFISMQDTERSLKNASGAVIYSAETAETDETAAAGSAEDEIPADVSEANGSLEEPQAVTNLPEEGDVMDSGADPEKDNSGEALEKEETVPGDPETGEPADTPAEPEEEKPVVIPVSQITLNKTTLVLDKSGAVYTLTAAVKPADATDKKLVWSSDDTTIASVNQKGAVTARKAGRTKIRVKSAADGKVSSVCTVTVNGLSEADGKYYKDGKASSGLQTGADVQTVKSTSAKYESAAPVSGHTYEILCAADPRFALDISGGSYASKANADIYRRNGTEAQAFTLIRQSDGSWQILNYKGMTLDVAGGSSNNKANLQTYAWNGSNAQKFTITANGDGSYRIAAKCSGKVLDVSGGKFQNKQNVQQYAWNKTNAQKWIFTDLSGYYFGSGGMQQKSWKTIPDGSNTAVKAQESAKPVSGHTYMILSAKDPNFALDIYGGSDKDRANVDIYKKNGSEAQAFVLQKQNDGSWQILNFKGKTLDIAGGSVKSGANLQTYTWNGTDAQKFDLTAGADGTYTIINRKSRLALDVAGGRMENKQNVRQYTPNGTAAQKWILKDLSRQYYFGDDGAMTLGWKTLNGKTYYFSLKGIMAVGWQKISGKTYYFSANGVMVKGWQTIRGKKYWFDDKGVMASGWKTINGKRYYFDPDGVMATGRRFIVDTWYRFHDTTGEQLTGRENMQFGIFQEDVMNQKTAGKTITGIGGFQLTDAQKSALQSAVNTAESGGRNVGFLMVDITTGKGVAYNAESKFYSASTVKGPYVAAMTYYNPGTLSSERGKINSVLAYSSNEDYYSLRARYGESCIRSFAKEAGVTDVDFSGRYTFYTPRELAKLWMLMYSYFAYDSTGTSLAPLYERAAISIIRPILGGSGRIRSKGGWCPAGHAHPCYNDAGIVYDGSRPYVIVVLSNVPYGSSNSRLNGIVKALKSCHDTM